MAKTLTAGVGGRGTHAVMKAPSKPKMSDYDLNQVRIERVENGCTVECNFKMKPEAEKAIKGKDDKCYVDYDIRNTTEKHVFNNIGEAAQFIEARLLGKDYDTPAAKPASKTKVRVI